MPKACSLELRERVVDAVESGASRRAAAEWFDVSPSSAVKWMQRRLATGSIAAKPRQHLAAGGVCGLFTDTDCAATGSNARRNRRGDAQATDCRQPQRGVALLSAAQNQRQKKVCGQWSKSVPTWPALGGAGCENRVCLIQPDWCLSTRPQPTPPWCDFEVAARAVSD